MVRRAEGFSLVGAECRVPILLASREEDKELWLSLVTCVAIARSFPPFADSLL